MDIKNILNNLNEDIISSKPDDSDYQILKKRFEELKETGRWKNFRSLKAEFMRRRVNQSLIDKMGKDKVDSTLERLYNRGK